MGSQVKQKINFTIADLSESRNFQLKSIVYLLQNLFRFFRYVCLSVARVYRVNNTVQGILFLI